MCVAHADATGEYDAIEVGLVCVRNLQVHFCNDILLTCLSMYFVQCRIEEVDLLEDGHMVILYGSNILRLGKI